MRACGMRCAEKWVANVHKSRYKCITLHCVTNGNSKSNGNLLSALALSLFLIRNTIRHPHPHFATYGQLSTVTFNQISLGNFINERKLLPTPLFGACGAQRKYFSISPLMNKRIVCMYREYMRRRSCSGDNCSLFHSVCAQMHPSSMSSEHEMCVHDSRAIYIRSNDASDSNILSILRLNMQANTYRVCMHTVLHSHLFVYQSTVCVWHNTHAKTM